jgi:glycosyltransferase involved in cell wall biosynthesis
LFAAYDSVDEFAVAIEHALDPNVAADLVRKGNARIKAFTWDASVARLVNLFEAVIRERAS